MEQITSHNAKEFIEEWSRANILLMDSGAFVKENCELAPAKSIDIQIELTRNRRRGPALRLCSERFGRMKYKRRKDGKRGLKYTTKMSCYTRI
ncbi:MAG: hypothetical protein ACP6IQ_10500 [Candidatus Njordarchaeia archaeon]